MRKAGWMVAGLVVTVVGCGSPAPPAATGGTAAAPGTAAPAATSPVEAAPQNAGAPAAAAPPGMAAAPANTVAAPAGAPAAAAATPAPAAPPAPEFKEVTVPNGTTLAIELKSPLSTATAAVEDPVEGVLRRPLVIDGAEVVPAGAMVSGSVTSADRAGRVKGVARLTLRFTRLSVGDEVLEIGTSAIAREARTTKKRDAAKVGIGAGAGALVGAIAGGKKGAVVGGAVGAGAGTGVVLATRGEEVVLGAGASLSTTLTRPLVIRVPVE